MKIKFIVDSGEHLEGDLVNLPDELANEHLEANHAVETGKAKAKKEEAEKED